MPPSRATFPRSIIVLLAIVLTILPSTNSSKSVSKRSDIDLQTCLHNFDVHKDKIIRTQDSKDMGAKYINEIDLGSREECSRLCCETENCDVFVYEEKNSGSCYLFQCGPPEDFRCMFTHHANYSSAILSISRHPPDLESQIKLTKHEQELNKLNFRKLNPDSATVAAHNVEGQHQAQIVQTTLLTSSSASTKVQETQSTVATSPSVIQAAPKCSRYQFECRSNKECIAIYNACDGIPQCADGSDEAPELGCPETLATTQQNSVARVAQNSNSNFYGDVNQIHALSNHGNVPPVSIHETSQRIPVQRPPDDAATVVRQQNENRQIYNAQRLPQPPPQLPAEGDFIRPDGREPFVQQRPIYGNEEMNMPAYQPQFQGQQNWPLGHQMPASSNGNGNQFSQQYQPYEDVKNRHIFNHKESGLQVSEGQGSSQTTYGDVDAGRDASNQRYANVDDTYLRPRYQNQWQQINRDQGFNAKIPPYDQRVNPNAQGNWMENVPVQPIQQNRETERQQTKIYETPQNPEPNKAAAVEMSEHEKMAHDLQNSKHTMEKASSAKVEVQKIKIEKIENHLIRNNPHYAQDGYKLEDLDLQDGMANTPGGAVLSLTLGLIITCVMALLIGCRLRMVRRRIRRGGKAYAHDADYLVNGMYL